MPSRRHTPEPSTPTRDPAEMFAAALRESEARDRARREKEQREREAAARAADEAAAAANALAAARRDLERAIEGVRAAKRAGRGVPEADAAWRAAKARIIELETGAPPAWARGTSPVDGGAVGEE